VDAPVECPPRSYGFALSCGEHSPRHVRRIIRAYLHLWDMPELTGAAELGATELLANVVRHVPDRWCRVTLLRQDTGIRLEVTDHHPALPVSRTPGPWEESGRGLSLVALLTDAWGVSPIPEGGKTIWLELKA
jgi:histidine kinase-like protein